MRRTAVLTLIMATFAVCLSAQTNTFTYQGKLTDGGSPAGGTYDILFKLFDAPGPPGPAGTQIGSDSIQDDVSVSGGIFTVVLNFGPDAFTDGGPRYLEIYVRPGASNGGYTVLSPRQMLTSAPYSIKSKNSDTATTATNSFQLGGIPAASFTQNSDPRLSDARNPLPNSPNYVQNTSSQQPSSNFNISGNGTAGGTLSANIANANSHYRIAGLRVFAANGPFDDGTTIVTASNTFAGDSAGLATSPDPAPGGGSGKFNAFFGAFAGKANTSGQANSFFGSGAGEKNTGGVANSFFGTSAGNDNTSGSNNSFYGVNSGIRTSTGGNNAFFGVNTGIFNFSGENNSFFGTSSGFAQAGQVINTSGNDNTTVGFGSKVALNTTNQTAIGSRASVTQADSLVLGSINGINGATADTKVGIGTTAPAERLHVSGTGIIRARINSDSNAGVALTLNNQPGWSVATASGGHFQIFNDFNGQNVFWINRTTNLVGIGTISPNAALDVNGTIRIGTLEVNGTTQLCRENLSGRIASCSSSARYKTNVNPFAAGLSLIDRLRPVSFNWKTTNEADMGLVAEEVAKIEPLLVTRNEKGEIEAVKYDRVAVVLINAVKQQQAQIERLQKELDEVKKLMHAPKKRARGGRR